MQKRASRALFCILEKKFSSGYDRANLNFDHIVEKNLFFSYKSNR